MAAVSPTTTRRVLKTAGIISARNLPPKRKGQGFVLSLLPHDHWHGDFTRVQIAGTFHYL